MIITPERAELIQEAKQLREFGYTQQMIADTLGVPQQTVSFWLRDIGKSDIGNISKDRVNTNIKECDYTNIKHSITLYKCK